MSSKITTQYKNEIADREFGKVGSAPTTLFIGWSSTEPTETGTGYTEPSGIGTGYARIPIQNNKGVNGFTPAINGVVTNQSALNFARTLANLGVATHWLIFGSQTGNDLKMFGALVPTRSVEVDTILTIEAGAIQLQVSNLP